MKTIVDGVDIALMLYRALSENSSLIGSKRGILRAFKEAEFYKLLRSELGKLPQPVTVVREQRLSKIGQGETKMDEDVYSALTNMGFSTREARELASNVSGETIEERISNAIRKAQEL